jgi:hypothetical protein
LHELAYVLNSKPQETFVLESEEFTFHQQKNDPNKITKPTEEEWNQLDLQLANNVQNIHQTLLLKMSGGHVWPETGLVRPHWIYPVKVLDLSG